MIKVMFLIPSLEPGGAERQIIELAKGLDKARFDVTLTTFYDGGALRPEAEQIAGLKLISLKKAGRWDIVPFLLRLWTAARAQRPQIVHGYMGLANNLSLLVGRAVGAKVVWGLRASNMDYARYAWADGWVFRTGAWLSRFADLLILNSYAGQRHYVTHGYHQARMLVIPNGIDTDYCHPDLEAGTRWRAQWGIGEQELVIGLVGRLDPMKGHLTFLGAAARLAQNRAAVRFVCVGSGPEAYAAELRAFGERLGLGWRLLWTGTSNHLPAVYNALDCLVSASSYGEGFSNVIGEAMACAVPCVVTDVGDSALIVGDAGRVVPPNDAEALAEACQCVLDLPPAERRALGDRARRRLLGRFNRRAMVEQTETALTRLAASQAA